LVALCSPSVLPSVQADFLARRDSGELSPLIFDTYLAHFQFAVPSTLPTASSILLVASPIGRSLIELDTAEGLVEAVIPPTYGAEELQKENEAILEPILKAAGCGFARAWLPNKSLAAGCGLGRYGKDNILRFERLGSYVRLDAWWTELPADPSCWGPPQSLERCAGCGACARACPNRCIREDRFTIDASRCLTFMNESSEPFPPWVDPSAHNAAVGCLRCQDACPENRASRGREAYRRLPLNRAASEWLIAGKPAADLPEAERAMAEAVLSAAEMVGAEAKLGRNLRALLAARSSEPRFRA
jgi:epoxyqueuosine reductase